MPTIYLDVNKHKNFLLNIEDFEWSVNQEKSLLFSDDLNYKFTESLKSLKNQYILMVAELAIPRLLKITLPAIDICYVLENFKTKKKFYSNIPQIKYFLSELSLEEITTSFLDEMTLVREKYPGFIKSFIKPIRWAGIKNFPKTITSDFFVLAESEFIYSWLKENKIFAKFVAHESFLKNNQVESRDKKTATEVSEFLTSFFLKIIKKKKLEPYIKSKLIAYCDLFFFKVIHKIAINLLTLRKKKLPTKVITGAGSNFSRGLVTAEILRRGGEVIGFDHFTGTGCIKRYESLFTYELPFASKFVLSTSHVKKLLNKKEIFKYKTKFKKPCQFIGANGFKAMSNIENLFYTKGSIDKILYVSPIYRGWRQSNPITTSDPVQLDWENHLIEQLQKLTYEFSVQFHPEGIFKHKDHPFLKFKTNPDLIFESKFINYDLLIFDWCRSSSFWTALCSNKPIIIIEKGYSYKNYFFSESIQKEIDKRVIFIRAYCDKKNRLRVDRKKLNSVIKNIQPNIDGSFFRKIFLNELS
tara:strand:+ start:8527 stop:10107 length:1581 start_codon:yes stop_codon:yes gene_type:complete